jgi:hydroxypyruvate isomerase
MGESGQEVQPYHQLKEHLMLRFAANLSMLFSDLEFLERFGAAAEAGFKGVEYLAPYQYDKQEIAGQLRRHGLKQALFNMPAGDRVAGDRGIACQPGRRDEFNQSITVALDYAVALECPVINCLAGIGPPDVPRAVLHQTYVENLRRAAAEAAKCGVRIVIEPLNPTDFPGFFLTRTDQAAAIVAEVGAPNLGIEYDVFHAQMAEGNLVNTLKRHMSLIWHMQVADVPTRQEPGTGEIRFDYLFQQIDALGYTGWIGCDYHPSGDGHEHFGWLDELRLSGLA